MIGSSGEAGPSPYRQETTAPHEPYVLPAGENPPADSPDEAFACKPGTQFREGLDQRSEQSMIGEKLDALAASVDRLIGTLDRMATIIAAMQDDDEEPEEEKAFLEAPKE